MIKSIIFDWGRTLHDPDAHGLFPGAREVVEELAKCYTLVLKMKMGKWGVLIYKT